MAPGGVAHMEVPFQTTCPFCGQELELRVDASVASQHFTTDCEVCCRPLAIRVECEPGEILGLEIAPG